MSLCLAILMDHERLHHERRLLAGLSCALVDQGVTLIHIVPEILERPLWEGVETAPEVDLRLETQFRGSPWLRSLRAHRLIELMERETPDFIFGIGAHTWPLAARLGTAISRPVGLDIWTRSMTQQIPRGRRGAGVAAYVTPTHTLHNAVRSVVDPDLACHVPWGIDLPNGQTAQSADDGHLTTVVIAGGCRDVRAYQSLLSGLSRVIQDFPGIQAILELGGPNEHEIWRIVSRLGLHSNVTITPDAAGPEQLLTRCDALLLPERYGEMRSIVLYAMGAGMTLIAAADPVLDMVISEETALVLEQPDAHAWATTIRRILTDRTLPDRLSQAARRRIQSHHTATQYASRLIETVQSALDGGALQFPARKEQS